MLVYSWLCSIAMREGIELAMVVWIQVLKSCVGTVIYEWVGRTLRHGGFFHG
jgi:hypothetical protein